MTAALPLDDQQLKADFRTLWNNQELWETSAVAALNRIEEAVARLAGVAERVARLEAVLGILFPGQTPDGILDGIGLAASPSEAQAGQE